MVEDVSKRSRWPSFLDELLIWLRSRCLPEVRSDAGSLNHDSEIAYPKLDVCSLFSASGKAQMNHQHASDCHVVHQGLSLSIPSLQDLL